MINMNRTCIQNKNGRSALIISTDKPTGKRPLGRLRTGGIKNFKKEISM